MSPCWYIWPTSPFDPCLHYIYFRGQTNACSYYPCDYCFVRAARGKDVANRQKNKKGKGKKEHRVGGEKSILPPKSSLNKPKRTKALIEEILTDPEFVKNDTKRSKDQQFGIKEKSSFHNYPGFDVVIDIVADYMHSMCLGVTRLLFQFTYDAGELLSTKQGYKVAPIDPFDQLYLQQQVTSEMSRKTRKMAFGNFKAQGLDSPTSNCLLIYHLKGILVDVDQM